MTKFIFKYETGCKTVTYCLMHFSVAITVAYLLTHDWKIALSVGIIEPLVQTFFFNLHERGWKIARWRFEQQNIRLS